MPQSNALCTICTRYLHLTKFAGELGLTDTPECMFKQARLKYIRGSGVSAAGYSCGAFIPQDEYHRKLKVVSADKTINTTVYSSPSGGKKVFDRNKKTEKKKEDKKEIIVLVKEGIGFAESFPKSRDTNSSQLASGI